MNKIKTLISAEDFVLHHCMPQTQEEAESESILAENFYRTVPNYAQLLKRKPTLDMFVPCVDGVPMKEPTFDWSLSTSHDCRNYKTAKEQCLFDGFEVVRIYEKENTCYVVSDGTNEVTFHIGLYTFLPKGGMFHTLSDIAKYNLPLTSSALKQIYQ